MARRPSPIHQRLDQIDSRLDKIERQLVLTTEVLSALNQRQDAVEGLGKMLLEAIRILNRRA